MACCDERYPYPRVFRLRSTDGASTPDLQERVTVEHAMRVNLSANHVLNAVRWLGCQRGILTQSARAAKSVNPVFAAAGRGIDSGE